MIETPASTRRAFLTGLISFVAAPAIVRASSLMPVKIIEPEIIQINYGITRTGGGVCLTTIKDLLLPGLRKIVLDDEKYSAMWEKVFATAGENK
jgi:hypothetical protein